MAAPGEQALEARYETLRRGALGLSQDPAARAGLAVLLGRGMWAWAQTVSSAPPRAPRSSVQTEPIQSSPALARLIADLSLASARRSP